MQKPEVTPFVIQHEEPFLYEGFNPLKEAPSDTFTIIGEVKRVKVPSQYVKDQILENSFP